VITRAAPEGANLRQSFVDCTGFCDLAALAGAKYTEPNDYPVVNSMGVGGGTLKVLRLPPVHGAITQLAKGLRDGHEGQISAWTTTERLPAEFRPIREDRLVHDDHHRAGQLLHVRQMG